MLVLQKDHRSGQILIILTKGKTEYSSCKNQEQKRRYHTDHTEIQRTVMGCSEQLYTNILGNIGKITER